MFRLLNTEYFSARSFFFNEPKAKERCFSNQWWTIFAKWSFHLNDSKKGADLIVHPKVCKTMACFNLGIIGNGFLTIIISAFSWNASLPNTLFINPLFFSLSFGWISLLFVVIFHEVGQEILEKSKGLKDQRFKITNQSFQNLFEL